jgi:drug/metabolite transporter (DMT)-like permease
MRSRTHTPEQGFALPESETQTRAIASQSLDLFGFGLIMLSTLLAASQGVAAKFGLEGFSPYNLIAARSVLALLVMLAISRLLRLPFPSSRRSWLAAFVLGILQVGISGTIFFWALNQTPVGRATLLTSTQPFLMVIAAHFLFAGERLTLRKIGGLLLGFSGVVIVVLGRGGELGSGGLLADGGLLLAASLWAASQLLVKMIAPRWHMMSLVTAQMAAASAVTVIIATVVEPVHSPELTLRSLGGLAYLSTVGTAGMFFLMFYAVSRYEVSIVSSFIFLQPVLAVILGWLLLDEQVTPSLLLSMALVALGLVLVNQNGRRKTQAPQAGAEAARR